MPDLNKIYLFRMTHIENIPHILKAGLTHLTSPNRNTLYVPIGDSRLINTRNSFEMPNGDKLGDYIPFYLGSRMPMLYVIQRGFNGVPITLPQNIIYCISSIQKIIDLNLDFMFTDGHAVNALSNFYEKQDAEHIEKLLDFAAIRATWWNEDLDIKRRKEAEFLVAPDVPLTAIIGYVVYNEEAKAQLINMGIASEKIVIRANYYF